MSRNFVVPTDTASNQRRAADPDMSIWVEANAGSGKTHVLTQRVLRLLLSGCPPQSMLCLTYTKAAAAEMRRRVSRRLASWTLLDDAALSAELEALTGEVPKIDKLSQARTHFGHALETPGGLKIVTIHAFCESVLHRFPLEAGVPFDFTVIEEDERNQMVIDAREAVLAGGLKGSDHSAAVQTLFSLLSDSQITDAIDIALTDGRKLRPLLADRPAAKDNLRQLIGFNGVSASKIDAEIVGNRLIGPLEIARILELVPPKNSGFEFKLANLDPRNPTPNQWLKAFLTAEQTVPLRFPSKAFQSTAPELAALALEEAERLQTLAIERKSSQLIERSEALLDVLGAISDRFEARKRARSLLDFDDLIEKLGDLFEDPAQGPWVQYKLDAGITHILVDESQDTNPEQWRVVREIAREFFSGDSAIERPRTLFAVGDQKQSIYSFQGADPRLFGEEGRDFARKAAGANKGFARLPLHTSFRTLSGILAAVDKVCDDPVIQAALLSDDKVHHGSARPEAGGMVTLWPPVHQPPEDGDASEWPIETLPVDKTAPRQIAERIAGQIRKWVDDRRPYGADGKVVTPDDVLILVQSRNAVFHEIIRALLAKNLPTPGADRLAVTTHIAVLDLLALCDVLLNPADNLQLAALLRSPLFDIDEDALFNIARGRPGRLWESLSKSKDPLAQAAYQCLLRWRGQLDFERPFEFFAHVLYADGGLKRFHARMGGVVDDVFAQLLELALDHEQSEQPSLQGFVAAMRARNVSIKRELSEAGGGVRVMTVHGAKGLEAPIVILADAASKPKGSQTSRPVYVFAKKPGPLVIHAPGKDNHVEKTLALREGEEANLGQEYWRKLYVAMTRGEDELYVTGALTPGAKAETQLEGTWYQAMDTALRADSESIADADGIETALVYPRQRPTSVACADMQHATTPSASQPLDLAPVAARVQRQLMQPSRAFEPVDHERVFDTALERVIDAEAARREGIALHALLQHLALLDCTLWPMILVRAMPELLPDTPERHDAVSAKAVALLENPELAEIFGPGSRAEVPFAFDGLRDGKPIRLAGRIDRLVVTDEFVLVVDYKSDSRPPISHRNVPSSYRTQIGLYALVAGQLFPNKLVRAAILWTALESLMIVPQEELDQATIGFTNQ